MNYLKMFILIAISTLLFISCYEMGQSDFLSPEVRDKALGMRPAKDQVFVYVYRKRANVGTIKGWPLILDGKPRTQVKNNSFVLWITKPGEHTIMSKEHENEYNVKETSISFVAEAGKSYYFRHKITMDFKIKMEIIPEQKYDAQPYINKYHLIDMVND